MRTDPKVSKDKRTSYSLRRRRGNRRVRGTEPTCFCREEETEKEKEKVEWLQFCRQHNWIQGKKHVQTQIDWNQAEGENA